MTDNLRKSRLAVKDSLKSIIKTPWRPLFHFHSPINWMNDPNGLIFKNDKFHVYYQYNPYGKEWGNIHWGHAISQDLVYWEHRPIAMAPEPELNEKHCFSGCCVLYNNKPTFFYTSIISLDHIKVGSKVLPF